MPRLDLHTFRLQGRRSLPYLLSTELPAAAERQVTREFGFPYLIDSVTISVQAGGPAQFGFQLYIAQDADLPPTGDLLGDKVFPSTSLSAPAEPYLAWHDILDQIRLEPSYVNWLAPSRIKVAMRTSLSGAVHIVAIDIVPLDWNLPVLA